MNALEYGLSNCPDKILSPSFLEKLGDGFHGEAYLIPESNQVIKYSLVNQEMIEVLLKDFFNDFQKVICYQQNNNYPCFVKVLNFNSLVESDDSVFYSTTMEKLNLISVDEKRVLKTVVRAHRDLERTWAQILTLVRNQSYWLDFDLDKMVSFINLLEDSPIVHHDMSSSNIMKDENGNFKLIDLDFSKLKD